MPSIVVKGMTCNHCSASVTKAISSVAGVGDVEVDLASGKATYSEKGPVDAAEVKKAVEKLGFEVMGAL